MYLKPYIDYENISTMTDPLRKPYMCYHPTRKSYARTLNVLQTFTTLHVM